MNKLEKIESVLYQLKSLSENSEEYISYYFNDIKTSVDLRRETLKQDIDSYSDQILDQIERTKGECIKISVKIRSISKELEVYTCEVDRFKSKLNNLNKYEEGYDEVKNDLLLLEIQLNESLQDSKNASIQNKVFTFHFDNTFNQEVFGKIIEKNNGGKIFILNIHNLTSYITNKLREDLQDLLSLNLFMIERIKNSFKFFRNSTGAFLEKLN